MANDSVNKWLVAWIKLIFLGLLFGILSLAPLVAMIFFSSDSRDIMTIAPVMVSMVTASFAGFYMWPYCRHKWLPEAITNSDEVKRLVEWIKLILVGLFFVVSSLALIVLFFFTPDSTARVCIVVILVTAAIFGPWFCMQLYRERLAEQAKDDSED